MAKGFLDMVEDAFDDDALTEVIPIVNSPNRGNSTKRTSPKKKFRKNLESSLQEITPRKSKRPSRRKSFLDTIEEALEDNAFDDLIPRRSKLSPSQKKQDDNIESRFSTMITTDVLKRAREIAELKGIRIKDVINIALKRYIDDEYESPAQ